MRTFILPSKDTTIYQRYPTYNSGLDEILEVGKLKKSTDMGVMYASSSARALISFDITASGAYPTSSKYFLNLYLANATNVFRYQKIEVLPISQSWVEGSGYRYQDVKNAEDGATWISASSNTLWTNSGSDFTTNLTASVILSEFPLQDIRIDVTTLIAPVISGSNITPWNGLILKFPTADEANSSNTGNIKIFSSNTHTVYSPTLEIVWNDQIFTTGNLKPIPNGNVSIVAKNLKEAYTEGEIDKVYLVVRDRFPDKRFDATQRYKNQYYLPSSSYFRLKDQVSGVTLQKFDQYSAVHCDASGSYILLDTNGLYSDRYYTLDLKVSSGSLVFFPEFLYTFKIDRTDA